MSKAWHRPQRDAEITLSVLEGRPLSIIAHTFGVTETSVRFTVQRTLERLCPMEYAKAPEISRECRTVQWLRDHKGIFLDKLILAL